MRNVNAMNGFQSEELLQMPRGIESFGIECFKDSSKNLDEIFGQKSFMQLSCNLGYLNSIMSSEISVELSFMGNKIMRELSISLDKFCHPPISHDSETKMIYDVRDNKECLLSKMSNEIGSFGVESFIELSKV